MAGAELELDDESFAMHLHDLRDQKACREAPVLQLPAVIRRTQLLSNSAVPIGERSTAALSPKLLLL